MAESSSPPSARVRTFRCASKQFAITYPQCDVSMRTMFDWFVSSFHPRYLCVARELHEDGHPHLHVCAVFNSRKDVQNERYFDFKDNDKVFHPNIKKCRRVHWWDEYVKKGGDFLQTEAEEDKFNPQLFEPGKRKKTYEDIKWSNHYIQMLQLKPVSFPLDTGKGFVIEKPDPAVKRRNIWFVSDADAGKTYWVNRLFQGMRVYYVTPSKNQYWFERYDGEDIIICDDVLLPFSAIANILNTHLHPGIHVAGQTRYAPVFWKNGHTRTMIVLTNERIETKYGSLVAPMLARFRQIDFSTGQELVPTSVVHVTGCTSNPCTCIEIKTND